MLLLLFAPVNFSQVAFPSLTSATASSAVLWGWISVMKDLLQSISWKTCMLWASKQCISMFIYVCSLQPEIELKVQDYALSRCKNMYDVSSKRCRRSPLYGRDLVHVVQKLLLEHPQQQSRSVHAAHTIIHTGACSFYSQQCQQYWLWVGFATCSKYRDGCPTYDLLCEALPSLEKRLLDLEEIIKR